MPIIKDEELRKKQSNYWHPVKGAAERWKSSWNNGTNPIKAALDLNLLSLVPGLNLAQVVYDTNQTKEDVKTAYNSAKQGNFTDLGLLSGTILVDLLGAKKATNDLQERARKSMYQKITPLGYSNQHPSDTKSKKKQFFEWITDVVSGRKIDTNEVPEWKKNLENFSPEKIDSKIGLNSKAYAEFRDQAYRKALKINPRNESKNIYTRNADGKTYSYNENVEKIRKETNSNPTPSSDIFVPDSKGNIGDYITGNGGWVSRIEEPDGSVYMYDKWDLHPFSDGRTLWKWGSKNIPGLKKLSVSKILGMDEFELKHKVK